MSESYVLRLVRAQSLLAPLTYRKGTVMPDVFVCYRTSDETFTGVLIDEKLAQRFGPDAVFRDARGIELGEHHDGRTTRRPLLRLARDWVDSDRRQVTAAVRSTLDDREDSDGRR